MSSVAVTFLTALSMSLVGSSSAFHSADIGIRSGVLPSHRNISRRLSRIPSRRRLILSQRDSVNGDGESNQEGGDALAREFYDLIRTRNPGDDTDEEGERDEYRRLYKQQLDANKDVDQQKPPPPPPQLLPEDEARSRNRDPFGKRREVRMGKYDVPAPLSGGPSKSRKRFTGGGATVGNRRPRLDSTGTPSAGLFSGEGSSVYSYPATGSAGSSSSFSNAPSGRRRLPGDARSRMVAQEFNLLGRSTADGAFVVQAAVLVLMIAVYAYVGMSGGITDGSDRFVEASEFNPIGEAMDSAVDGISAENWSSVLPKIEGSVWL